MYLLLNNHHNHSKPIKRDSCTCRWHLLANDKHIPTSVGSTSNCRKSSSIFVELFIKFLGRYTLVIGWVSYQVCCCYLPTSVHQDSWHVAHCVASWRSCGKPPYPTHTPSLLSTMAALTSPTLLVVQSWDIENTFLCVCIEERSGHLHMPECFRIKNYTNKYNSIV